GRECCDRNQRDQRTHDPGVPAGGAAGEAVEPRRREQPCAEDQVDHVDERLIPPFLHDGDLLYEGRPRSQTPSLISGESGTLFQASVCAMRKRAALLTAVRELIRPQAIPFAIGCPPPPDRKTTDRHISPAAVDFRPIVLRSRRAAWTRS